MSHPARDAANGLSPVTMAASDINGIRTAGLVFVCLDRDRLQIFGFEDLLAVEAFHIVHTVAAGDDYRFLVLAGCLHTKRPEIRIILTRQRHVSRGGGAIRG